MARVDYAKQVEDYQKQFPVGDIVRAWFRAQSLDPAGAFYLFFKMSNGQTIGALSIAQSAPEGFETDSPGRISPAWTMAQAERFVWDSWNRLPVLPTLEKKDKKPPLVLWGFHPAHGNIPLKLEEHSAAALKRRKAEGWTCGVYREGDAPTGLSLLAKGKEAN
jgi:hypothetical protein